MKRSESRSKLPQQQQVMETWRSHAAALEAMLLLLLTMMMIDVPVSVEAASATGSRFRGGGLNWGRAHATYYGGADASGTQGGYPSHTAPPGSVSWLWFQYCSEWVSSDCYTVFEQQIKTRSVVSWLLVWDYPFVGVVKTDVSNMNASRSLR